jgi:hypothetical protein
MKLVIFLCIENIGLEWLKNEEISDCEKLRQKSSSPWELKEF